MIIALTILIIVVAILLVLIVLAQNSKGGGLSSTFGGGASQLIGVKKTGDALEKVTWGLAIGVLVLTMLFNIVIDPGTAATEELTPAQRRAQESGAPTPAPGTQQGEPLDEEGEFDTQEGLDLDPND
ncbi:MAG: preprotein translocase subunit SecG [Cytophagaceae bacterium]